MFHVKHLVPHVLLINPWITDFAAYNLWVRPLGLLRIARVLRRNGFRTTLIDCLNSYQRKKEFGHGKFSKVRIEKPPVLKSIPRNYSQYGISEALFEKRLNELEPPDLVAVTSGTTYWYPGLFKTIRIIKKYFPASPVMLGGIYATICYDHAKSYSGADYIVKGKGEGDFLSMVGELIHGLPRDLIAQREYADDFENYPCFELYNPLDFICITTSAGCPFRCPYCASSLLEEVFTRREPAEVVAEIQFWVEKYRVGNIVFYDDALLVDPREHIIPVLKEVLARGIHCNFHAPNGLHIREIDDELARLLFQCHFKTIRLGLETSNTDAQARLGGKVNNTEFERAIRHLKRAGYSQEEIGVYILAGLPWQRAEEVQETIRFVRSVGGRPILVEYSPIPGTPLFEKAKEVSQFDIENEPLFHNNSLFPCQWEGFTFEDYRRIKISLRENAC